MLRACDACLLEKRSKAIDQLERFERAAVLRGSRFFHRATLNTCMNIERITIQRSGDLRSGFQAVATKTESGSKESGLERKGPFIGEKPAMRSHARICSML